MAMAITRHTAMVAFRASFPGTCFWALLSIFALGQSLPVLIKSARGQDASDAEQSRKNALVAWRDQSRGIESARIILRGQQSVASDFTLVPSKPGDQGDLDGGRQAIESEEYRIDVAFAGHEGWSRIETNRPHFHLNKRRFVAVESRNAFDGRPDGARTLEIREGQDVMDGTIHRVAEGNVDVIWASMKPLFLSCRPFSPAFSRLNASDLLLGEKSTHDRICLVSESRDLELWVGTNAPYAIHRVVFGANELSPHVIIDILEHQQDGAWTLPRSWRCTYFDHHDNQQTSMEEYEVVRYELNPKFEQNDFRLRFPEGTVVARNDIDSPIGQVFDYVSADDEWVRTDVEGVSQIYEYGPGAFEGMQKRTGSYPLFIALNAIAVLVLVVVLARKYFVR
jgi:hypothetical protein